MHDDTTQCFLHDMMQPPDECPVPAGIQDKHDVIFGNIQEIYHFHKKCVCVCVSAFMCACLCVYVCLFVCLCVIGNVVVFFMLVCGL